MRDNVYSVAQINTYIKNMFAQDFVLHQIQVKGEVSNCKYHSSGHIYFTLKDGISAISVIMFAGNRKGLDFPMRDGNQVVCKGAIEVYERDGRYQLYAREIKLDGLGDLYLRFEELKRELEEMGMFATEYKQPIPRYIKTLGVVTAPTGAAIQDIRNITHRRNPYVQLILYPALVQGEGAAASIVNGIHALERQKVDTIIVGRGGGSIEDLWAFNEEIVARAIFECEIPVISAVGHETDTTISDFVADLRAPTPSAAAELAVFDYEDFRLSLRARSQELYRQMTRRIQMERQRMQQYQLRMKYVSPTTQLNEKRRYVMESEERLKQAMRQILRERKHRMELYAQKLDGLSPLKKMQQGYSFVTDEKNCAIHSVEQVEQGDKLQIHVLDGIIEAQVEEKQSRKRVKESQLK